MGGSANAFSLGRKHNFRSQSALPCSSCAQFGASLYESKTDHLQKLWLEPATREFVTTPPYPDSRQPGDCRGPMRAVSVLPRPSSYSGASSDRLKGGG